MASATGLTVAANVGTTSTMEAARAKCVVMRNSRILVGVVFLGSLFAAFGAVCFALIGLDALLPMNGLHWDRVFNALMWGVAALSTATSCPWLWKMGRSMAYNEARLDLRGVDFRFGTKKKSDELFLAWDQITAIRYSRSGNNQVYRVAGSDGSEATFTSYTFFRPKKLAKLIAARTGRAIEKG